MTHASADKGPFRAAETPRQAVLRRLPQLSFGGAPIGNLYAGVAEADAIAAVRHAWQLGVRHFDTAPYYGYGLSETRLGAALAGISRADYSLSTKVGRLLLDVDDAGATADDGFAVRGRRRAAETQGLVDPMFVFAQIHVVQEDAAFARHAREEQQPADAFERTARVFADVDRAVVRVKLGNHAPALRAEQDRTMTPAQLPDLADVRMAAIKLAGPRAAGQHATRHAVTTAQQMQQRFLQQHVAEATETDDQRNLRPRGPVWRRHAEDCSRPAGGGRLGANYRYARLNET